MSQVVARIPTLNPQLRSNLRRSEYDRWFDGRVHKLRKGVDFDCSHDVIQVRLHNAARRRGIAIVTRSWGDEFWVRARGVG